LVRDRCHDLDREAELFFSELLAEQGLVEPDCPVLRGATMTWTSSISRM